MQINWYDKVHAWLRQGAPLDEGVSIYKGMAGDGHPFLRVLRRHHHRGYPVLVRELCRRVGISPGELSRIMQRKGGFRDDWPFLHDPLCPPELKILAANKITAYWNYVNAHERLFDCRDRQEQFATVKELVENYLENRRIIAEFLHYRQHGHVLGRHPIFEEMRVMKQLRQLGPLELMERKQKLEHNIWRTESELRKGDKPHLKVDRERRLLSRQRELAEVERILEGYK